VIGAALWTLAISALGIAPGWLAAGDSTHPGMRAAWGTLALVLAMLLTALAGFAVHQLGLGRRPSAAVVAVSLVMTVAAWRWRGPPRIGPGEWQGWAYALGFAALGLIMFALFTADRPDGSLIVHRWYNADGFKHLGHVHALANWGVPARDIFGNGGPLYYYWLSYIVPGAATALGGDAVAATVAWNAVVAALFGQLLYAAIRAAGARPGIALATCVLATFVTLASAFTFSLLQGTSIEDLLTMPTTPNSPALFELSQYIPQHCLAAAMLLALILIDTADEPSTGLLWCAWIAFASVLAVSTLLGAMAMLAYGLLRLWRDRQRSIAPLAAIGTAGLLFVIALHVVKFGPPAAAVDSPLFANPAPDMTGPQRTLAAAIKLLAGAGLPLILALYILARGKLSQADAREWQAFAAALLLTAFATSMVSAASLPTRITIEMLLRAKILVGLAVAITCGGAFEVAWRGSRRQRRLALAIAATLTLVALPGNYIRIAWLYRFNATVVPADDRNALAYLRANSAVEARVWQFPEPPVLAFEPGEDAWAPIFAGRMVANSQRATDFARAAPYVARSEAYFAGMGGIIPPDMDWVYLSRALHPATFDRLAAQLRGDAGWKERRCYPGACLFARRASDR
jgi:hypothetical protein